MKSRSDFLSILSFLTTVILVRGNENSSSSADEHMHCHPWSFYNHISKQCECYSNAYTDDIVKCTEHGVLLRYGFCMTFKEGDGFYVGQCNYFDLSKYNISDTVNYISLPGNVSYLNHYMCALLNSEGPLCGQCKDGYGHTITSVGNTCEKCYNDLYWLAPLLGYLFLELLHVIVMYFVLLLIRVRFSSAPLMIFILYCQMQEFVYRTVNVTLDANIALYWRVLIAFYGIFNLNFFQYIIPPFCVSPSLKAYQVVFLDYIPVIYLLLLLILTRVCIKLHSNNFRPIMWLWKKLNRVLVHINARWDKIVDAFVTVFLLSYTNLVFTSISTAILPLMVWNAKNFSVEEKSHVYLDPDIEYYSEEHLPFVFISSLITFLVVLPLPVVLALYPIKCFRSLLFRFPIVSRHMGNINTFLEKIYYCYRDGLDGGRDMRSFAPLYYFVYWLLFALNVVAQLLQLVVNIYAILFAMVGFLIAIVRPYKRTFMNVADTLILANLSLFFQLLGVCSWQKTFPSTETCYILFSLINTMVPFAVIIVIGYRVFILLKKSSCCRQNITDIQDDELVDQNSFNLNRGDAREISGHLLHSEQHNQENNYGSFEP